MEQVISLHRYPIKGFRGETLSKVQLTQGEGVPGDRMIGISKGTLTANDSAPFFQLHTNPELLNFRPNLSEGDLALFPPTPESSVNLLEAKQPLQEIFGQQADVITRQDRLGHWDFDDSMISIINIETVAALSEKIGRYIDPLRFRANIYIKAKPFSEFNWLGKSIQIGTAHLSIIRPTKRCSATSVNPEEGKRDINVPAQLNRHFGHAYCGVYAHVETSGEVRPNDQVITTQTHYPERLTVAVAVPKAPPMANWPRPVRVSEIKEEASGIRSFWLEDSLSSLGSLDQIKAGQHLALHGLTNSGDWRRYTISDHEHNRLRITVKRDTGVGSQALHALQEGQVLCMTGPFGAETLDAQSNAILILSAGIGITPTITKLKALIDHQYTGSVQVIHTVRRIDELVLWQEVQALSHDLPDCTITLYVSGNSPAVEGINAVYGRPNIVDLVTQAAQRSADIHVCGPEAFQSAVTLATEQIGAPNRLFMDSFVTPDADVELRPIPQLGPFSVTFNKSGMTASWQPSDGPLLEFAESKGLVLAAHCRAGVCKMCACKLIDGDTFALTGTSEKDAVLLCCSVPASDITLEC